MTETESTFTTLEYNAAMAAYQRQGEALRDRIGNRGPLLLDAHGKLHPDILAAYWQHGFYVFDNVIADDELAALRADIDFFA